MYLSICDIYVSLCTRCAILSGLQSCANCLQNIFEIRSKIRPSPFRILSVFLRRLQRSLKSPDMTLIPQTPFGNGFLGNSVSNCQDTVLTTESQRTQRRGNGRDSRREHGSESVFDLCSIRGS